MQYHYDPLVASIDPPMGLLAKVVEARSDRLLSDARMLPVLEHPRAAVVQPACASSVGIPETSTVRSAMARSWLRWKLIRNAAPLLNSLPKRTPSRQ